MRLIEEQVAKRAAAAEAEADKRVAAGATAAANADKAKPEQKKGDVGTVAALGVAVGAIGTAFAAFAGSLSGVLKLPFWQVCLAVAGLLLLISGPSMLIAWLKLRQRNLGPILDANGWAINGRVKMNVPFGGSLTAVAAVAQVRPLRGLRLLPRQPAESLRGHRHVDGRKVRQEAGDN